LRFGHCDPRLRSVTLTEAAMTHLEQSLLSNV
jgi:hypothetical protein